MQLWLARSMDHSYMHDGAHLQLSCEFKSIHVIISGVERHP